MFKMYSANVLCTYIVAFSQEVKCKSISFCCCRSEGQTCGLNTVKQSMSHSVIPSKTMSDIPEKTHVTRRQQSSYNLKTNLLTMSHITTRAL